VLAKLCQGFAQAATLQRVLPRHRYPFARHTRAQVRIPFVGDALFNPLVAEALVAVVGRAARQQHAVGVMPREDEVEERRR